MLVPFSKLPPGGPRTPKIIEKSGNTLFVRLFFNKDPHACLLAFKLTHGWGNSARSAMAGKGAEARFALLCQCSLPTSSLRVLRSSLYCRLSSDLHSFRFCTSCAHVSWASRTSQGDRSSVVRHYHGYNSPGVHQGVYNAHHFSEERSLKGVLFPGSFTVSLVERGEGA